MKYGDISEYSWYWLVVWNMKGLFVRRLGVIIPTDELIFFQSQRRLSASMRAPRQVMTGWWVWAPARQIGRAGSMPARRRHMLPEDAGAVTGGMRPLQHAAHFWLPVRLDGIVWHFAYTGKGHRELSCAQQLAQAIQEADVSPGTPSFRQRCAFCCSHPYLCDR